MDEDKKVAKGSGFDTLGPYGPWIVGLLLGISIGISIGVAMGQPGVGIAIGAGIGVSFGIVFNESAKAERTKKAEEAGHGDQGAAEQDPGADGRREP